MSDLLEYYNRSAREITDDDLDKIIADLRSKRHTFKTLAKKDSTKAKSPRAKAAENVVVDFSL